MDKQDVKVKTDYGNKGRVRGFSLSPVFVCAAGILWGMIGLFVRRLNGFGLGSMEIVALRSVVTAVLMFFVLLVYRPSLLKIHWKDLWCFLGTGILSIVFFNFCYFSAIDLVSLSVAAVLLYTAPAFVLLMSALFFKEKITVRKLLGIAAVILGCALVSGAFGSRVSLDFMGILYGIGAGVGYALYSIFSRFALQRGYTSMTITFYTFLVAAALTLPLSGLGLFHTDAAGKEVSPDARVCVTDVQQAGEGAMDLVQEAAAGKEVSSVVSVCAANEPQTGGNGEAVLGESAQGGAAGGSIEGGRRVFDFSWLKSVSEGNYKVVLFCILFGVVSTVLPYILYTVGLAGMDNSKASVIASIEPITATLLGLALYRESISLPQVIGIVLVLGGIIYSGKKEKEEDKEETESDRR